MNLFSILKKKKKTKLQFFLVSLPSSSSADLSQPVVCLGVGDDGLHSHDGLVDLGLQLSKLLDVQQAQDLSRLVQSGICEDISLFEPAVNVAAPRLIREQNALTSGVEAQGVFVQADWDTLRNKESQGASEQSK